jgi:hypothetical protein
MEDQLVTCPDTGSREEIRCLVARDGEVLVVLKCTRFDPPEAVTCKSACVACVNARQIATTVERDDH